MNDYVKNLQSIEGNLNGNYSTSLELNVETIIDVTVPQDTITGEQYIRTESYPELTDTSVDYMAPKKVTVKRYILKK